MINYGDLIHRIILKSNTDEEANALIDEIFSFDRKDFFIFLKSMALVIVNLQKEIRELKEQLVRQTGGSTDASNY